MFLCCVKCKSIGGFHFLMNFFHCFTVNVYFTRGTRSKEFPKKINWYPKCVYFRKLLTRKFSALYIVFETVLIFSNRWRPSRIVCSRDYILSSSNSWILANLWDQTPTLPWTMPISSLAFLLVFQLYGKV